MTRILLGPFLLALFPGWSLPQQPVAPASGTGPAQVTADTAAQRPRGAPVVVRGDTVLYVPTQFGPFTAADRAAAIAERIGRLSRSRIDSLVVVAQESTTDILAGDMMLMTITEADAAAVSRPRGELAAEFAAALMAELERVSRQATLRSVVLGTIWTVLATLVLALVLVAVARVFPRLYALLDSWRHTRMPAIRIQRFELFSADNLTDLSIGAVRFLRLVLVIALLYFYLPLVLSFFPWTERYSGSLLGYVASPLLRIARATASYLPNLVFLGLILLVTRFVLKLIRLAFGAVERGALTFHNFEREWAEPTYKIVRLLVMAFALVVLFPYLPGSRSEAFKGVTIFLGVLFSLGSSSAVANVVAGVVLTYTRAFRLGDRVRISDAVGDVVGKTLLVTRIRTIKNEDITIPNAMVMGAHIVNYTAMARTGELILHTRVTIGYDAPWRQVHELLLGAAAATPGLLLQPEPFVLQISLDDFYVTYELNAYTDQPAIMARTYSLIHANIQDRFNQAGIEIMSPHYGAMRDGNTTTIPVGHHPPDYMAPAFRVERVGNGETRHHSGRSEPELSQRPPAAT